MAKQRRFAKLTNVEVRIGTTPASIRDILLDIATCAAYNRDNTEDVGSPQQKDQAVIFEVLEIASREISKRCAEHWKNL